MKRKTFGPFRCILQSGVFLILIAITAYSQSPAPELPQVFDTNWQLQAVEMESELVTPIGCCFDHKRRLIVVESHTHFPSKDYSGPSTDRIYLIDAFETISIGASIKARKRLFYEGGVATMGVAKLDDGWIAVATRNEVARIRDSDGDIERSFAHASRSSRCNGPYRPLYSAGCNYRPCEYRST